MIHKIDQDGHGLMDEPIVEPDLPAELTPLTLEQIKRKAVSEALLRNQGNRKRTARDLGLCIRTVRRLIIQYGFERVGLE